MAPFGKKSQAPGPIANSPAPNLQCVTKIPISRTASIGIFRDLDAGRDPSSSMHAQIFLTKEEMHPTHATIGKSTRYIQKVTTVNLTGAEFMNFKTVIPTVNSVLEYLYWSNIQQDGSIPPILGLPPIKEEFSNYGNYGAPNSSFSAFDPNMHTYESIK